MRVTLVSLLALVALVAASPFPDAQAATTSASASAANPTSTRTRHKNPHHEPVPTFKQKCECKKPAVPVGQMNQKEKCQYNYYLDVQCYYQAQGGCPMPTLSC